jgi:hypothetical protein
MQITIQGVDITLTPEQLQKIHEACTPKVEPKRDWKVLAYRRYSSSYVGGYVESTLRSNGLYLSDEDQSKEGCYPGEGHVKDGWDIYSVKYTSEPCAASFTTFTIGDYVEIQGGMKGVTARGTITEFEVRNNFLYIYTSWSNIGFSLHHLKKLNKPAFTTDDGMDVFNGDKVFHCYISAVSGELVNGKPFICGPGTNKRIEGQNYFSNEEACLVYIKDQIDNEKAYSINDIKAVYGSKQHVYLDTLIEQLQKSK